MAERLFAPTAEGERAYISERFAGFARSAWAGSQRFGRGLVLISVQPPDAPRKAGTIDYVSDSAAELVWPGRGWPDPAVADAVRSYDPHTSFLVLVIDYEHQTCRLHRFEGDEPLARFAQQHLHGGTRHGPAPRNEAPSS